MQQTQTQDKLIFYASIFVYNPRLKAEYKDYCPDLSNYESRLAINE